MFGFVARQPVLDREQNTWGYELLFRSSMEDAFATENGDAATSSVMDTGVFQIGLSQLTGGRRAFLNFTHYLLIHGFAELLPRDQVVVEILETVRPEPEILAACSHLRQMGYILAMDDFEYDPSFDELLRIAHIVKLDFKALPPARREVAVAQLQPFGVELLAEKVETREEYLHAVALGCQYFQGYYFSRPEMLGRKRVAENKATKLQLLKEVSQRDLDMQRAEAVVKHDPTMTMRLLKYINSAAFGVRNEVRSIRQALTLLGQRNLRKWATVLVMAGLGDDKPPELMRQAVFRARFCELLGQATRQNGHSDELFMVGMFSLLDALTDQPRDQLFAEMPVSEEMKAALLESDEPSFFRDILNMAEGFEDGSWEVLSKLAATHHIPEESLPEVHRQAVEWAEDLVSVQ